VWQIPLLLLFSLAMFSGHSRVATVVHLAALAFLFCTGLWSKASRARVVIICLISISGYLAIDETAEQESINREEGYTLDMEKTGWSERLALWSSALSIYKDHPFLGAGHATFKSLYPAYRQQGDLRTLGNFVHNDYLQLLSEGGPLALVLIVCWVAYLLYWLFRHARAVVFDADAQQSIVAVALILAMGCILAHALMSFILLQASVFFLMAALFARIVMINNHQSLVLPVINHPWLMKGMLFFIALVLWLSLFLDCLSFGMVYQQKGIPYLQTLGEQPDKRVALMKFLKRLRPNTSINHMDLAKIYEASASYQPGRQNQQSLVLMAAQEFELALEANPYSLNVLYFSADLREKHPWLERVKTLQYDLPGLHDHALKVAPSHVITALRKAQYLEARGRYKAAYRQLQAAMPWVDVRHSGFREARLDYLAHLSRLARKNNDRPVIEFVRDKLRWPE
ncbi:MAG: O-antigen ligase family protein, partial [Gammaproteobacteria bacterium]|nr:O-antigen ligase family protein [Gammaproteobacteria bacterium]